MQEEKTNNLPFLVLVLIAAIAGIIAGAAGVYMTYMGSGNGSEQDIAEIDCSPALAKAVKVQPFAKGEVAALTVTNPPVPLAVGSFSGPDGKQMTMESLGGKTRLVNLWATWCIPCREEMPALNALQKSFGNKKFEVVAINIDAGADDGKPRTFLKETGVDALAFYRDGTMGAFNVLKKRGLAFGLPVTVLIDEKGCMLGSMNGPAKWDSLDAKTLIKAAL